MLVLGEKLGAIPLNRENKKWGLGRGRGWCGDAQPSALCLFLFIIILNLTDMDLAMDSDNNFNYYHEYCRAYLSNIVLLSQMRELVN